MASLFYANLGIPRPEIVLDRVSVGLRDFRENLTTGIHALQRADAVLRCRWRPLEGDELRALRRAQPASGTWVELDDFDDRGESERALRAFFDDQVREVFDLEERSDERPDARVAFARERQIAILDRDPERQRLCLARAPGGGVLALRPNTYALAMHRNAVHQLMDRPSREHASLLQLFQGHRHVAWKPVELPAIPEEGWFLLRSPAGEAALRPGTGEQREFVRRALGTPDFAVLEGPPGSGKTTAICELILQALRLGRRVLLCASTHVAVDNVLERLMDPRNPRRDEVLPVRVGEARNVSERARAWQFEHLRDTKRAELREWLRGQAARTPPQQALLDALDRPSCDAIDRIILDSANLVCGTTVGILQHPDLKGRHDEVAFDLLVVDEASKTTFQEFLVPALMARRWVLVGDARQLSPYVDDETLAANVEAALRCPGLRDATLAAFVAEEMLGRFADRPDPRIERGDGAALFVDPSDRLREFCRLECEARGVPLVDLDAAPSPDALALACAGVVVGTAATVRANVDRLPLDLATIHGGVEGLDALVRRVQHRRDGADARAWGSELSWRLVRDYERRLTRAQPTAGLPQNARPLLSQEASLLLAGFAPGRAGDAQAELLARLDVVRRVALPSVLESLQRGFERRGDQREGTALSDGLPEAALRERHVRLTWQHRMHPDLSAFPRARIYEGTALRDAPQLDTERRWDDPPWTTRDVWVDVDDGGRRGAHGPTGSATRSPAEARAVARELERFGAWGAAHPRRDGEPWEVAVLTFYRAQERELRERLRALTRQPGESRHFALKRGDALVVRVELCTVDRFQGHEADVVMLSFGRTRGVGFLDSLNRLNVAITRARYQRVTFGRRANFDRDHAPELLRDFTRSVTTRTYDIQEAR